MYSKRRPQSPSVTFEPVEPRRLFSTAAPGPLPTSADAPDLSASAPHLFPPGTHAALAAGDAATVSLTLTNAGAADVSSPFAGKVYLSQDDTLSADDLPLTSFQVAALAAGDSAPLTAKVTLPESDAPQTWYPIAIVDPAGTVADDADPTNNTAVGDPLTLAPKHLTLRSISLPDSVQAGSTFTLTALADATGLHPDDPNFLTATIHRDFLTFQLNPVPTPLVLPADTDGSATPSTLLFTATLTLPDSVPPGPYALELLPTLFKGTADFAPDFAPPTLNVTTASPYLSLSAPASAVAPVPAGEDLPVAFTATNAGGSPSSPSTVTFYLSKTQTLSAKSATRLGTAAVSALAPAASRDVLASFDTTGLTPGSYYLLATLDSPNAASFADTLTTAATPVPVTIAAPVVTQPPPDGGDDGSGGDNPGGEPDPTPGPPPVVVIPGPPVPADLALSSLSASTPSATAGSALRISITPTAPKPVIVRYYLSRGATLSPSAIPLGNLPASTSTASLKVPANVAPGTYHLLAKIDPDNAIAESDESNNTAVAPGLITVFTPALTGEVTPAKPRTVRAGDPASLTLSFTNPPDGPRNRVHRKYNVKYFLSSDDTFSPDDTRFARQRVAFTLTREQSQTFDLTYNLPSNAPLGSQYVIAVLNTPAHTPSAHMEIASTRTLKVTAPRVAAHVRAVKRQGPSTYVTLRLTNTGTAASTDPITLLLTTPNRKKPLFSTRQPLNLAPGRSTRITLTLPSKRNIDPSTLSATIL